MRLPLGLMIFAGAMLLAVAVWHASGGRALVFFLPLLLGLPLLARRSGEKRGERRPKSNST